MKIHFIVNPHSANGETGRRWAGLRGQAERACPGHFVEMTKSPLDATTLASNALRSGADVVVAVGGDGTINEVVNGFFVDGRAINPNAALGIIPRGTGGDFRRSLKWTSDVEAALSRISANRRQTIDVGLLEYRSANGSTAHRYFANVCSFGVSGAIDREVDRSTKMFGGKVSFYLGTLKGLLKYRDQSVRISFDGKPAQDLMVTTVAVGNGQYFGGGMKVCPAAELSDGLFDVTVWSGYGPKDFVLKSAGVYSGEHVKWPGTRTLRCRELTAESDEEVLIDCDGEQPGTLPCRITLVAAALQLVI